jgi:hypothetical protein
MSLARALWRGAGALALLAHPAQAEAQASPPPQRLDVLLRHYFEDKRVNQEAARQPWVQAMQANYATHWQRDQLSIGLEASLFAALTLDGAGAVGEVAHQRAGATENATVYPGRYTLQVKLGKASIKYGLQSVSNPVLDGKDNLWLPPTFRGVLIGYAASDDLKLDAGRIDAVNARAHDGLQVLSSAYGGQPIARLEYVGANWNYRPDGQIALYANRARDVWEQLHGSISQSLRANSGHIWTGGAAAYRARNLPQGTPQDGAGGRAYSLSLSRQKDGVEMSVMLQRMLGPGFMDYVQESYGLALPNVLVSDYNAPDEQSLQLKWKFDESALDLPGTQFSFWFIGGRSATPARAASAPPVFHARRHAEFGLTASHQLRSGALRGSVLALTAVAHSATSDFPDPPQHAYRLTLDMPFKVF